MNSDYLTTLPRPIVTHRPTIPRLNDGSQRPPSLRVYLNMGNVDTLPPESQGPRGDARQKLLAIRQAGYDGVQCGDPALCLELGLGNAGSSRFNHVAEIGPGIIAARQAGYDCLTVHIGWGHEDDDQMDALVSEILAASAGEGLPVFIETHRATITQDTWRTVKMVSRHPEVRFNGDFSHWYTGLEMVYGDFTAKVDFIAPVLERVRFMHGRMGNSGHIQVPLSDPTMPPAIAHFHTLWVTAMAGFHASAQPGDYFVFAPELLYSGNNYSRLRTDAQGRLVEESDRWVEAQMYARLARQYFAEAAAKLKR